MDSKALNKGIVINSLVSWFPLHSKVFKLKTLEGLDYWVKLIK